VSTDFPIPPDVLEHERGRRARLLYACGGADDPEEQVRAVEGLLEKLRDPEPAEPRLLDPDDTLKRP
jgi:hypothetical protein